MKKKSKQFFGSLSALLGFKENKHATILMMHGKIRLSNGKKFLKKFCVRGQDLSTVKVCLR